MKQFELEQGDSIYATQMTEYTMHRTPVSFVLLTLALSACNSEIRLNVPPDDGLPPPQTVNFDFADGDQGWQAGFADYPVDNADIFNLQAGVQPLPNGLSGQGFFLGGDNRSDDLFMYIRRQFIDLEPSTEYRVSLQLQLLSNAGEGCVGIGGAPGESVFFKLGYAEQEPLQAGYNLNVDIGNQSQDGMNAKVIGNVASSETDCSGVLFGGKQIATTTATEIDLISDAEGRIWLFLGTDSGFEGRTEIYLDTLSFTLSPVS